MEDKFFDKFYLYIELCSSVWREFPDFIYISCKSRDKSGGGGQHVSFILPSAARDKKWEIDLGSYDMHYVEFNTPEYDQCILSLLEDKTIIHTNFLDPKALLHIQNLVGNKAILLHHEHMRLCGTSSSKLKEITKELIYGHALYRWQFIGVSPAVYQDLCKWFGKKRSYLVTNAISYKRLDTTYSPQLPEYDKPVASIFGTHFLRKGTDLAIRAIEGSKLKDQIYLLILAHCPKDTRNEILESVGHIPDFVKIARPVTDVQEVYHKSFVFLSPSRSEAFGYAVIEAAYVGTQVIASDIPGQNTMKDVPGLHWVTEENANQLRTAIEKCYDRYEVEGEGRNEVEETKHYIKEHYSLDAWTEQVVGIYRKIGG